MSASADAASTERSPLIPRGATPQDAEQQQQIQSWPPAGDTKSECRSLWQLFWPIWTTQLLDNVILINNVVVVGHLGVSELAAMQLSTSSVSVLGMSVLFGLNTALDTLANQGWTGSSPKVIGLHAQRQAVLASVILVPQLLLLWNSKPILLLLRQDPHVADLASRCLRVQSFFLPFMAIQDICNRWLAAQGRVKIATGVLAVACPLSVVLNWSLVWHFKLGLIGSPIATVVTWAFMAFAMVGYSILFVPRDGWPGLTWSAFTGLGPNLRLGCYGVIMSMCDWIVWEAFTIAAGTLGPIAMAAQSILFNAQLVFFQSSIAASSAAAVRMGNCLGAGHPKQARLVLHLLTIFAFAVGFTNLTILVPNIRKLARLFTNDEDVILLLLQVFPIVAFYQVVDQVQGALYGPFRATGRMGPNAWMTLVSFWVIGLPLALFLGFSSKTHMGLLGLWIGMGVGSGLASVGELLYCHFVIDYEQAATEAKARNEVTAADLANSTTSTVKP